MKIVYLVDSFPKLSETFILNQITGLIDRGHEVKILALNNPQEKQVHEEINRYNILTKTHYICYRDSSTLLDTANTKALASCLDADLIHAHFATKPTDVALDISMRTGIPYIVTIHAYDIFINPDVMRLKTKFLRAEKVITCSYFNKNYLINLISQGLNRKIDVVPYGINLLRFKYIERKPKEIITVIFVGRLVEKKGILDAIAVCHKVVERSPSVVFRIVGDGPLKGKAMQMVEELNIQSRVNFLGGLTQVRVIEEMKAADIFFLPSLTASNGDSEGLPVVILEAQAMGLPVVSTQHTGIPEAVINGKTALLVPERDTDLMADRICKLIVNPDLRIQMGKAGRNWVESRFDMTNEIEHLEKTMLNVVSSRKVQLNRRVCTYFPQVLEYLEQQIQQQASQGRYQAIVGRIRATFTYQVYKKILQIYKAILSKLR
jgi:colanic acid/amylovoran biosynthesis glycosyltransferase